MKEKRLWLLVSLMAILALFAVACGQATEAPEEEAGPMEDTGTVFILGAFRGEEQTAFEAVIAAFEEANPDIDVLYSGTAEFETLITVRVEAGDPPDIAAFPQPGAVAKLANEGHLAPLWDEALAAYDANYQPAWKDLGSVDGVPYGMFHRVNAKGWIWYNKPAFEAAGYSVPGTWDELMALTEELKGTGIAPWCDSIGSGAATGWKGTDWVENLMLRTQPVDVYDSWVAHDLEFSSDEVKGAWEIMAGLWEDPDAMYGGSAYIATTDFKEPPQLLFTDPPQCWLHMQGSFVTNFFQEEVQDDLDNMVGVFMMPPIDESLPFTMEVGGDQFVVFSGKDRPEVRKFIEFLATPASVEPWASQGGSLFPHIHQDLSWYPTLLEQTMAGAITTAEAARFDGSDGMDSEVNLAFWKAVTDWISGNRTLEEALADVDATLP
jgi:alpha-glucoside transport system substrate-binding protein